MNPNGSLLDMQTYRTMLTNFAAGLDKILSEHTGFIAAQSEALANILSEHTGFIAAQSEASEKRDAIRKECDGSTGNLFLPLFKFRLENFHSEMLRTLLDTTTPEIGNLQYVNRFMQLLREINPAIQAHTFTDTVSVVCEAGEKQEDGRIDVFTYDDLYGVIIENKINGAPDQPNQLAKYLKYAKRMGKNCIAIVYIPPLYKNSPPPLEGYDEAFQEYIPEIREKLVVLPAVDSNSKKDLVHGFLGACLELPGNNDTQKYLLSQYTKLLISLKGGGEMTKDVDMALLAECYKDQKSISVMENIGEVWNNRECLLGGLLWDTVRDRLVKELGFTVDPEDENFLYKRISDAVSLCFFSWAEDYPYWFGFWSPDCRIIKDGIEGNLQEALDTATPGYFGKTDNWGEPEKWLLKKFRIGEYKKPLADIAEYFIGRYRFLEEKTRKALEA